MRARVHLFSGALQKLAGIGAALFDLDGTLIDTRIDFGLMRREVARIAEASGVHPPLESDLDIMAMVYEGHARLAGSAGAAEAAAFSLAALTRLEEIEVEQCADPAAVPGADELLRRMRRAGIGVGIVTRNSRSVAEKLLRQGGLEHDALLSRDDVPRTKPDPGHLLAALDALSDRLGHGRESRKLRPSEAVMVGDHWMDVLAGRRAGCVTVGLLRGRDPGVFEQGRPDIITDGVADFLDHLTDAETGVSRRGFLAGSAAFGLYPWAGLQSPPQEEEREMDLRNIPSYCSHEHWGSLASFGMEPEGFRPDVVRGAMPKRRTGFFDILLDPYLGGFIANSGIDVARPGAEAGAPDLFTADGRQAADAWRAVRQAMAAHRTGGAYQAIRLGLRELYGADTEKGADIALLNKRIGANYADPFGWYARAMQIANMRNVVKPVHPEYFWRKELGVDPADAASWRRFLTALMDRAASGGVLGIKQLQAYSRPLLFDERSDNEVKFRGDLSPDEVRVHQDWVMHECCKQAHDRGWPHQVHVGTHNLPASAPLPLGLLASRYRKMSLVLLHCWPYLNEAGWLAWVNPNVCLDTCWMPVLNPAFLREALDAWIGLVPTNKIMCGHDATSVEMAAGSAMAVRSALADKLHELVRRDVVSEVDARELARGLLHSNAERLYGWPIGAR